MRRAREREGGRPSRRQEILDAGLQLLAESGAAAMQPAALARRCGMTATAIRYHFPTDDDLFHALFDEFLESLNGVVTSHPAYPSWPDGIRALMHDYMSTLIQYRDAALVLYGDPVLRDHPEFGVRLAILSTRIRSALESTNRGPGAKAAAIAAIGAVWRPLRMLDKHELYSAIDVILDVALTGHKHKPVSNH